MATELIQLAVGRYDFISRGRHHGVDVRDVIAPSLHSMIGPLLDVEIGHIDWMQDRVGRYPFDVYGSLVVDAELGFALETQTLSLFDQYWFTASTARACGTRRCSTSSRTSGSATASPRPSGATCGSTRATPPGTSSSGPRRTASWRRTRRTGPNPTGYADFDDLMEAVYALGDQWRSAYGPVALPASADPDTLFSFNAYHGGALVLYALREKIGRAAFERVERAWVTRYRNESVGTADFIALASRVAGRDLRGFLGNWLYGTTTPPMPNHPDWTVLPVQEDAPAALAASAGGASRRSLVK